ncbi:coronin-like protein crn1 [Penicillium cosmopolitanum]|uniref:Coronin n=1 Tax=Penicillium cosmopolitanum TaxID=1131564 RepID=A0A9X0BE86_9EURO|nr:coronin-like protein crn1 [Penicillium cosmopolitanum]KAJ5413972.1 coronin-like protein crn1 [Penicillium cosmopolitanum]
MSGRFVRASKYRHVYGRPTKKDQCYDNLRISNNAWDTNLIKVNPKYLSLNWQASGGGAFAVIPLNETGKLPERIPLFRGHTAAVLDTDWNPFHDDIIASGSDDGKVLLWKVPENHTVRPDPEALDSIEESLKPISKLSSQSKKVGHVLFNPAAEDVLATTSSDTVKIWDIGIEKETHTFNAGNVVQSQSWSANGARLVTTVRADKKDDNKLKIWDPRQATAVSETKGHVGAKNSRAIWLGERDQIATTGFSRFSDRQLALWDIRAMQEPITGFITLDKNSGVNMPFWDDSTNCLYLAGRGDGNIRYFELENDKFEPLDEYKSSDPQRGIAFMPKRGVNMHDTELTRAYKTVDDTYIQPISFIVPRKSETFQDDIYPPTIGLTPAMSAGEWLQGKEAIPPKISMASLYDGEGEKEVSGVQDKPTTATDAPAPKAAEPAPKKSEPASLPAAREPVSEPTPVARPGPSMKDQGASMAAMVNKFSDDKEDEASAADDDDDDSSFEEVPKPVERTPRSPVIQVTPPRVSSPLRPKEPEPKPEPKPEPRVVTSTPPASSPASESVAGSGSLHKELEEIKNLITAQTKTIAAQAQQMQSLTAEIESLKTQLK